MLIEILRFHAISLLAATQPEVGYAWVKYKLEKDFTSEDAAQKTINDGVIPAVIGPGPALYIVDDHHTLCALDYSSYYDVSVTVNVSCDLRHLSVSTFWQTLQQEHLAYLASHPMNAPDSLPRAITYLSIPTSFSFTSDNQVFTDDPWRALAGFARKVTSTQCDAAAGDSIYCLRCMYRGCGEEGYNTSGSGVYFFEFQWAYFYLDTTFYQPVSANYWPSATQYHAFISAYNSSSVSASFNNIHKVVTSDWMSAAAFLVPLCRSAGTARYRLPSDIFLSSSTASFISSSLSVRQQSNGGHALPGYVMGAEVKLPDDPTCLGSFCSKDTLSISTISSATSSPALVPARTTTTTIISSPTHPSSPSS